MEVIVYRGHIICWSVTYEQGKIFCYKLSYTKTKQCPNTYRIMIFKLEHLNRAVSKVGKIAFRQDTTRVFCSAATATVPLCFLSSPLAGATVQAASHLGDGHALLRRAVHTGAGAPHPAPWRPHHGGGHGAK